MNETKSSIQTTNKQTVTYPNYHDKNLLLAIAETQSKTYYNNKMDKINSSLQTTHNKTITCPTIFFQCCVVSFSCCRVCQLWQIESFKCVVLRRIITILSSSFQYRHLQRRSSSSSFYYCHCHRFDIVLFCEFLSINQNIINLFPKLYLFSCQLLQYFHQNCTVMLLQSSYIIIISYNRCHYHNVSLYRIVF